MNKEILEIKIAELLDIPSEEKKVAFSIFKEKLASFLKVGEALRVKDIGIFQLKEKFSHSSGSDITASSAKNLTILFSSDTDQSPSDSLFLNLDLDKNQGDDTEFNNEVFQLGIGKSLITNIEEGSMDDLEEKSSTTQLEEKIGSLFTSSEKIENFDLWEDHFKIKETTNILDDVEEDKNLDEKLLDEEMVDATNEISDELPVTLEETEDSIDKDYLEDQFIELNDEEKLDSYLDENNLELDEIGQEIEKENDKVSETIGEVLEEQVEETDEEKEGILEDVEEIDEENESLVEDVETDVEEEKPETIESFQDADEIKIEEEEFVEEKSVIDEIEMELRDDEEVQKLEEELESSQLEITEESVENEIFDDPNVLEDITEPDQIEKEDIKQPVKNSKSKNKSLIYALIAAFIIIGALAIYYLFFNNSVKHFTNGTESELAVSEKIDGDKLEQENSDEIVKVAGDEDTQQETSTQSLANQKDQQKKISAIDADAPLKVTGEEESEVGDTEINDSENYQEKEISDNIYHDGYVYNVQVSSWKNREIAEKEVDKLVKKGFPAFIVKAYIAKFQGTWYRVRIGPYTSLDEAKIAKSKI